MTASPPCPRSRVRICCNRFTYGSPQVPNRTYKASILVSDVQCSPGRFGQAFLMFESSCPCFVLSDFMLKVFVKSGLGPESTYLPPGVNPMVSDAPKTDVYTATAEALMVMECVTELLERECMLLLQLRESGRQDRQ